MHFHIELSPDAKIVCFSCAWPSCISFTPFFLVSNSTMDLEPYILAVAFSSIRTSFWRQVPHGFDTYKTRVGQLDLMPTRMATNYHDFGIYARGWRLSSTFVYSEWKETWRCHHPICYSDNNTGVTSHSDLTQLACQMSFHVVQLTHLMWAPCKNGGIGASPVTLFHVW